VRAHVHAAFRSKFYANIGLLLFIKELPKLIDFVFKLKVFDSGTSRPKIEHFGGLS
jgi:hypothetical protein